MNFKFFKRKEREVQGENNYYASRFRFLWSELVPPMNDADTKQGELVRCIGNLEDESSRNANGNWDELNEEEVEFLTKNLAESEFFDLLTRKAIRLDLEEIRNAGRSGHGEGEDYQSNFFAGEDVFERLIHHVVDWCDAHPEPIELRPRDPNIRRFERDDHDGLEL